MSPSFVACVLVLCFVTVDDPDPKAAKAMVPVVFRVRVPADTPQDAKVTLSGSLPAAGEWREFDARLMTHIKDGRYAVTLLLPLGELLKYKITLGSWKKVEKDVKGEEIDDRKLLVDRNSLIDVDLEVAAWATADAALEVVPVVAPVPVLAVRPTITGMVRSHEKFASKILNNERSVLVWLPPGYADEPSRRYPVFYLQDGQNLFNAATSKFGVEWRADETADRLIRDKQIPPMILVAVDNTKNRINEYTYVRDEVQTAGGDGAKYAKFLIEELKPFIDEKYRTKPDRANTSIGGASLGGVIAMETTLHHPEVFGRCAVVSPSIWWANEQLIVEAKDRFKAAQSCKFWIDMGTNEWKGKDINSLEAVERANKLAATLKDGGLVPERDYHLEIVPGAGHQEADWAERFDRILLYLFAL